MTAGVAAGAYAGIPVTQRGLASAVALVTAHEDPDKQEQRARLARAGRVPRHARALHGRARGSARSPTRPDRRRARRRASRRRWWKRRRCPTSARVRAPLAEIAQAVAERRRAPPCGHDRRAGRGARRAARVAARRGPLAGARVADHARARAGERRSRAGCAQLGARVVQAPAIRVRALPDACRRARASGYDLICLTSANGVEQLFAAARGRAGRDARALAGRDGGGDRPGHGAGAARARRSRADVVPERFVAEALVEALAEVPVARALIARARGRATCSRDALRERGAEVDVVALYETVAEPLAPATLHGGARGRLHHLHLLLDGALLPAGGGRQAGALAGARGSSRSARSPARRCSSMASADVEAERHDIDGRASTAILARPRGRRAARSARSGERRSPPCISFLSDYGLQDEFVGVCHGVIARRCPRARVIDITHAIPRHDVRAGALALARGAPVPARRGAPRGRRPRRRRRAARARAAHRERGAAAGRPRQRAADGRRGAASAAWREAVDIGDSPERLRADVGAPSTGATCSRRWRRRSRTARRCHARRARSTADELRRSSCRGARCDAAR